MSSRWEWVAAGVLIVVGAGVGVVGLSMDDDAVPSPSPVPTTQPPTAELSADDYLCAKGLAEYNASGSWEPNLLAVCRSLDGERFAELARWVESSPFPTPAPVATDGEFIVVSM